MAGSLMGGVAASPRTRPRLHTGFAREPLDFAPVTDDTLGGAASCAVLAADTVQKLMKRVLGTLTAPRGW